MDTNDRLVVESHLKDFSSRLRAEADAIKQSKNQLLRLKQFLSQLEEVGESVRAYLKRSEVEHFVELDKLAINEAEFNEHVSCYHEESISQTYIDAEKRFSQAQKNYDDNNTNASTIKLHLDYIDETINKIDVQTLNELQAIVNVPPDVNGDHFAIEINETLRNGDLKVEIKSLASKESKRLFNISNAKAFLDEYKTVALEEARDHEKYMQLYGIPLEVVALPAIIEFPSDQQFIAAETAFQTSFKRVVDTYVPSEGYKFENNRDLVELSRVLLPDAFQTSDNDEGKIIERIEHYLNSINDKNKQLNDRKLQKIMDLVEEVSEAVSTCLDTVRRLDNFFVARDKQITGGYQVRLEREWSKEYPLNWINQFKSLIEAEVGVFAQQPTTLAKRLSDFVTLEEKMREAFYACGGTQSMKPTVQKLLDPNSYFDLSFTMKSPSGSLTSGSTGQTYTAVALLCIARLSLISNTEGKSIAGVRFMPIDEAEGLGSNFDMLYGIAQSNDYQIISMSVNPIGRFHSGEQYIYMLHKNLSVSEPVNYTPFAVFNNIDE